ncbi:MAG TPA: serine hydrolase domain-containing protein [Gemmatimonadales bacterium]|nr:serine hydrolase domain-containing protein [Gemmatimonadales bacterium]
MHTHPATLCCTLLLAASSRLAGQFSPADSARLAKRLDSTVASFVSSDDFSGVVLVADHGRVIYRTAVGYANREWRVPMTADAVFRIGSTSKQFTAALIMTLVEEGKLRLDGHISDYLPEYPRPNGDRVTIRQLLSHTSGIPEYVTRDDFFEKVAPAPSTPDELMDRFSRLPFEFEPGSRWSYSDANYVVLGAILEQASGQSYADLLRSRIAMPLGLTTLAVDDDAVVPHKVQGYYRSDSIVRVEPFIHPSAAFGAGALRLSAKDLLTWDQSLYGGRIFRDSLTVAQLYQPRIETGTPLGEYGFGLFIGDQQLGGKAVRVIQHGGVISGFVTGFWRMPNERRTVIVLSNLHSGRTPQLVGALADGLYRELPPVVPPDRH